MLVTWVYIFFKTHENIHLESMHFTMCKLNFIGESTQIEQYFLDLELFMLPSLLLQFLVGI